jgi:hypothetical protein
VKALSELRPCDNCGGPIGLLFYVVRTSLALVKPQAVREFFGMHQFFGGGASLELVENFAPSARHGVIVAGDDLPAAMNEFVICLTCIAKPLDLQMLTARANGRIEQSDSS